MARPDKYCFSVSERYTAHFAATLRALMEEKGTTQKELAAFVGIRPQSLAQYCSGETQPNGDKLLKIAEYFSVTVDYLLTGTIFEDIPVREMLGLSESTVENMKLVKDGYFEDSPYMLPLLDCLLGDKGFYTSLEKAAYWQQSGADEPGEDVKEFYRWKAAKALEDYLLDFLAKDLQAVYTERQKKRGGE